MIIDTQNPAAEAANRVQVIKAWSAVDILNLIERLARTQVALREGAMPPTSFSLSRNAENREELV